MKHESLSKKLRDLRKEKGWTLSDAAEHSGVHASYLSSIENRKRAAGQETLERLAKAYASESTSASELLGEFVRAKALDDKEAKRRKSIRENSLKQLGFLGRAVFSAICNLTGKPLERSRFKLLDEDEFFEIDWDQREIAKSAVIQVGEKNYRVRLMISEEPVAASED